MQLPELMIVLLTLSDRLEETLAILRLRQSTLILKTESNPSEEPLVLKDIDIKLLKDRVLVPISNDNIQASPLDSSNPIPLALSNHHPKFFVLRLRRRLRSLLFYWLKAKSIGHIDYHLHQTQDVSSYHHANNANIPSSSLPVILERFSRQN